MDYNQIRFFILNNRKSLSKKEIKTQLLKNGVSDAEIDLLINKFYTINKDFKFRFLFSFFIFIIMCFLVGFYLGMFNSSPYQSQILNKASVYFNSGLLPVELGVYGGENGVIDSSSKNYFSFKFKLKKNYKLIKVNDLTLRIITRDKVINYRLNPKNNDVYPFKIKKVLGNNNNILINPGDVFILKFPVKIDINEDETFNLLFLKNDKVFNAVTIKTPQVMKTNYVILDSVY